MARPLRFNPAGTFYHVTTRGDQRQALFRSGDDHAQFSGYLSAMTVRYRLRI